MIEMNENIPQFGLSKRRAHHAVRAAAAIHVLYLLVANRLVTDRAINNEIDQRVAAVARAVIFITAIASFAGRATKAIGAVVAGWVAAALFRMGVV